jgi:hypothetical protein
MPLTHADRVKETSTTTGTGTYNLAGAVTGFRTFVAGVGNGNTCYYTATDGTDWETGIGTVTDATPDTLARTAILSSSNSDAAVSWAAGTRTISCTLPASGVMPRGHIWGLTMSNAADTANDITVAAGEARDENGNVDMVLPAAITKRLDAGWAVGDNQGGLNTGAEANSTWYEVHLIKRLDTGVVDVMFTTTGNRATLPANYTRQRRIGWIRNDGSGNILQFTQVDDHFTLTTQVNDVGVTATVTATPVTLTAPPNSIARFRATATSNASVNGPIVTAFSEIVEGNVTPADTTGIGSIGYLDITGASAGHYELRVNPSSQIEHDSSAATGSPTFDISTFGWIDRRGRLSGT